MGSSARANWLAFDGLPEIAPRSFFWPPARAKRSKCLPAARAKLWRAEGRARSYLPPPVGSDRRKRANTLAFSLGRQRPVRGGDRGGGCDGGA